MCVLLILQMLISAIPANNMSKKFKEFWKNSILSNEKPDSREQLEDTAKAGSTGGGFEEGKCVNCDKDLVNGKCPDCDKQKSDVSKNATSDILNLNEQGLSPEEIAKKLNLPLVYVKNFLRGAVGI